MFQLKRSASYGDLLRICKFIIKVQLFLTYHSDRSRDEQDK